MTTATCPRCLVYADEVAYDNMIDHLGIRIPAVEAAQLGYNMRRQLTAAEQDEATSWAQAWLAEGLVAALGSDCGGH